MKFFFLLLLSLVFISANAFCWPSVWNWSTQSQKVQPTSYAIGNSQHPVIAKEYVFFLHEDDNARHDYLGWFNSEDYYDHQLMDSGPEKSPIIIRSGKSGNYDYSVAQGCDDVIISSLESQVAQQEFNNWRKHLSLGDIRDYLNNQIIIKWSEKNKDISEEVQQAQVDAGVIRSGYDKSLAAQFKKMDHVIHLLLQQAPHEYYILEEKWRPSQVINGSVAVKVALIISFTSSTERPVVSLAYGVNEYERFNGENLLPCAYLQFPNLLGKCTVPDVDY